MQKPFDDTFQRVKIDNFAGSSVLRAITLGLAALIILAVPFFAIYNNWWSLGVFWDLDIYVRAATDNLNAVDTYRQVDGMAFVYHPLVLHVFSAIEQAASLRFALTIFYLSVLSWLIAELVLAVQSILTISYLDSVRRLLVPLGASMVFGAVGITTLATGNLTTYLHFALIAMLLNTVRRKGRFSDWRVLLMIGIFTVIKPYFLAYILIPAIDFGTIKQKIGRTVSPVVLFLVVWASGAVFFPVQMEMFIDNIIGLQSNGRSDIGISFYRITQELQLGKLAGLSVHVAISVVLLIWAAGKIVTLKNQSGSMYFAVSIAYFVLTVINPRMKEYDLFPALAALSVFWIVHRPRAALPMAFSTILFSLPVLLLIVTFLLGIPPGQE